jgi:hypothetical protein
MSVQETSILTRILEIHISTIFDLYSALSIQLSVPFSIELEIAVFLQMSDKTAIVENPNHRFWQRFEG